jgi:hypothetical protein
LNRKLAPVAIKHFGDLAEAAQRFAARLFKARNSTPSSSRDVLPESVKSKK